MPYLKSLGITAVELLPVQEFNETSVTRKNPQTGQALKNYWGYDPVVFCAPEGSYSSLEGWAARKWSSKRWCGLSIMPRARSDPWMLSSTTRPREMRPVQRCVFADWITPFFTRWRMINAITRISRGTGIPQCQPIQLVREPSWAALRYWMVEMHVDGFRFDLASVLGRDETGKLLANAPLLERIAEDPILREVKIIARRGTPPAPTRWVVFTEAVGRMNGPLRDDVRRFWRRR